MQKNKNGMTLVETVVSLVIITMAFTVGFVGMGSGTRMFNAGATLKSNRSDVETIESGIESGDVTVGDADDEDAEVTQTTGSATLTITKDDEDGNEVSTTTDIDIDIVEYEGFSLYSESADDE